MKKQIYRIIMFVDILFIENVIMERINKVA